MFYPYHSESEKKDLNDTLRIGKYIISQEQPFTGDDIVFGIQKKRPDLSEKRIRIVLNELLSKGCIKYKQTFTPDRKSLYWAYHTTRPYDEWFWGITDESTDDLLD